MRVFNVTPSDVHTLDDVQLRQLGFRLVREVLTTLSQRPAPSG